MIIIPEGWVLAPCEPDLNQLAAAINAETTDYAPEPNLVVCDFIDPSNHVAAVGAYERNKADSGGEWTRAFLTAIYRAMLASAPPAPGGEEAKCIECSELIAVKGQGWAKTVRAEHDSGDINEPARRLALCDLLDLADMCAGYDDRTFDVSLAQTLIDLRYALRPLSRSPEEGLGTDGGETAQRRDEPLTPSPSLAELIAEARREVAYLCGEDTNTPEHQCGLLVTRLANALEARAARTLGGEDVGR